MSVSSSFQALLSAVRRDRPHWEEAYSTFVSGLVATGAGTSAPKVGERMPEFALPDSTGRWTRISDLLGDGPLVLTFQRGGWCPWCSVEMAAWGRAAPTLHAEGGRLAVVTPETGGRAALLSERVGTGATLLCDVDHGVAMALGLTVPLPDAIARRYRAGGLDLDRMTGGAGGFVPIPATFGIGRDGIVRYAFVNPDFRERADPGVVLAALGIDQA